jgi:hypothetical protein
MLENVVENPSTRQNFKELQLILELFGIFWKYRLYKSLHQHVGGRMLTNEVILFGGFLQSLLQYLSVLTLKPS